MGATVGGGSRMSGGVGSGRSKARAGKAACDVAPRIAAKVIIKVSLWLITAAKAL
jgi:hypothetical protein